MYYDSQFIKNKIKISTLAGKIVDLKIKGNSIFNALCPFHKEKTPSFFVNDDKGIYHCFGCGAHGDIFSFIMKSECLNYKDALIKLADLAGVQTLRKGIVDKDKEKNKLFQIIHEQAMQYYKQQLITRTGSRALSYVRSRGLSIELIEQYDLGYSPKDSIGLIGYLKSSFQEDDLIEAGVVNKKNNKLYDPFYNRLIFPIKDKNSKVIAFGGRIIDANQKPKYLNSSESKIFNKSSHLYGFDRARKAIYKYKNVLIVEGYMDVLALANHSILHTVAPLGTSIKLEQIKFLWDVCSEPTICFDNDKAGKEAAQRVAYDILPHVKDNQSLKIMILRDGKDPDEIIAKSGLDNFRKQIEDNVNLANFIFTTEVNKVDLSSPEKKVLLQNNLEKLCLNIHDKSIQKSYQRYFRDQYFEFLKSQRNLKHKNNYRLNLKKYFKDEKRNTDLYMLIACVVKFPKILQNNEIFENFVGIDLPYNLDKIRKMIFDPLAEDSQDYFDAIKSLFMDNNSEKIRDFFNNIDHNLIEATATVERIFKSEKIAALRKEIAVLQKNMLEESSPELMQKILYLKKNEQVIEKDLVN